MLGNKLIIGVVSLGSETTTPPLPLTDDRFELVLSPSITLWIGGHEEGNALNGRVGHTSNAAPSTDCLVIVGNADEVHRQQLVAQITDIHRGLPVVVISPDPTLALAASIMRQGAFSVASATDPAEMLVATVSTAATEGRMTGTRRQHLLDLRSRFTLLTAPERQVLDAMLDGLANKQIAQSLQIGLRTVELRRSKIMRKMGARSLAELVKFICQVLPAETAEPPTNVEPLLDTAS